MDGDGCNVHEPGGAAERGSAELQFKAAMHKEQVEGDLKGAIEQYRKIIEQYAANRKVAADALVRMALCYEKLGSAEARQAYERVLKNYADQKDAVSQAQAGLAKLNAAETARQGSALTVRRMLEGKESRSFGIVRRMATWPLSRSGNGDVVVHDLERGSNGTLPRGPGFQWLRLGTTVLVAGRKGDRHRMVRQGRNPHPGCDGEPGNPGSWSHIPRDRVTDWQIGPRTAPSLSPSSATPRRTAGWRLLPPPEANARL